MAIAFYMDVHIPKAITVGLRIREVDVLTTQEDGRREADDATLLDRAFELGRVMFSFDADMLREATKHHQEGRYFCGVIFAHPTQISVGECIRDLEMIAKIGELNDVINKVSYLPF